jgi:hypothetical protein
MNSEHTKHALEDLHPNIACMRHPDVSSSASNPIILPVDLGLNHMGLFSISMAKKQFCFG